MGTRSKKIVILASGSGSNAEKIIARFRDRDDITVELVLSNRTDAGVLDRCKRLVDWDGFAARRAEAAAAGRRLGIGIGCYVEGTGVGPYEGGHIRVETTGRVQVATGLSSQGQGHETVFAQIVADRLGMSIEDVEIVHGDTGRVPFGMGTYGSRSLAVGGVALSKALDKIVDKGRKIAAHALEASAEDVEFEAGVFKVAGTDRQVPFGDVAFAAYVPHDYPIDEIEPGLESVVGEEEDPVVRGEFTGLFFEGKLDPLQQPSAFLELGLDAFEGG